MEQILEYTNNADRKTVALKAFARIADRWSLTLPEASELADMSLSTWKRARSETWAGDVTKDQMLRLGALVDVYKSLELYFSEPVSRQWIKLPNSGPLFGGSTPLAAMQAGGLPKILKVRNYLDALRGGV